MQTKIRRWLSMGLLLVLLAAPAALLAEDAPSLQCGQHPLGLVAIMVNPPHITGNPSPDTQQYLLIRMKTMEGTLPIHGIIELLEFICLYDDADNYYFVSAYMPQTMTFNEQNKVFATSMDQTGFDLFFIVPAETDVESLTLEYSSLDEPEPSSIAFSDDQAKALIQR